MRILYRTPAIDATSITATNTDANYPLLNLYKTTRTKYWKASGTVTNTLTLTYPTSRSFNSCAVVMQNTETYPFNTGTSANLNFFQSSPNPINLTINSTTFANNRAYYYGEALGVSSNTQHTVVFNGISGSFYPQVSYIFMDNYLSLTQNGFDLSFSFSLADNSNKSYNNLGVAFIDANNLLQRSLSFSINNMNKTELDSILSWIKYCKKDKPFFVFMDENQNIITNKYELGGMFLFTEIGDIQHNSFGLYSINLTALEVV